MTRTPFDQFSKQFLEEFLTSLGEVIPNLEVPGESRFADIWFTPSPQPSINPQTLGLLGRIASTPCLLEPFRNQPKITEIRNCLLKLFLVQADSQRQKRRDAENIPESELPWLWILASSASDTIINGFGASRDETWPDGVYFLATYFKTAIIAINQLPRTEETLWLRLLGKGTTQQLAVEEVIAIPTDNERRLTALKLLANWKISIEAKAEIDQEDRELIMTLSQAYLEWEEKTERRGIQQGQRLVVENLLKVRFGEVDEQLASIIPNLLDLPTEEYTRLLLQFSREELLARFENPRA
ncbi:MAG: flagellar assembly protein H [Gloeotrichia echinulata IR180]